MNWWGMIFSFFIPGFVLGMMAAAAMVEERKGRRIRR